jgi:hypothetical protein
VSLLLTEFGSRYANATAALCVGERRSDAGPISDFMSQRNMLVLEEYDQNQNPDATKVFVNGVWVGVHSNAQCETRK